MGLHIRLHNINCPNPFEVSYRIAPTPGDETVISTGYTQYGSTYDSSSVRNYYDNPIILSGSTFDDIFFETVWIKIQDTVTDGYIIENIKIHSESYYDNCLAVCDFSGGTASEVLITPTATPEPTSIDPTATPTPTSTPVGPTPTPTPTENCDFDVDINIVTATPTPTTTYITLYGCGDYITDTYTPTGYTLQTHSLDLSSATSGDLITISYNANDRPNRFNIYGDSSLIANSGWVGDDNTYSGPWGTAGSLSGVGSGTFTFYYVDSYTYELRVDVGPANPSTLASDSWTVGISCTTPTPTPTPTPTTVITYNEFFIAGGVDESTSGTTYCASPGYNITSPIYSTASSIAGLYENTVYTDSGGTTPYSGSGEGVMYAVRSASGGNTYDLGTFDYIVISSEGLVTFQASISCSGGPPDIP